MFEELKVDYKAVGFDGTLVVADLPESTIKAALVYGLRRLIQDSCNSAAKSLRDERNLTKEDELPELDRKVIHEDRLKALTDGTIGVRSSSPRAVSGLSPELARYLTEKRKELLKESDIDAKEYKAADAAERTKMIVEWMLSQEEKHDRWTMIGAKLIQLDEERAKAIAALGNL